MAQDLGLQGAYGADAFTQGFLEMLAQQQLQKLRQRQQQQAEAQQAAQERRATAAERREQQDLEFRTTEAQRRTQADETKRAATQQRDDEFTQLIDAGDLNDPRTVLRLERAGANPATLQLISGLKKPTVPQGSDFNQFLQRWAKTRGKPVEDLTDEDELAARKAFQSVGGVGSGSDFAQFLQRRAKAKGKSVDDLTDEEELEARTAYGRADDAERRPFAPVVIQTPTGPQLADRTNATARPITEAGGAPIGLMPTADQRNRGVARNTAAPVLASIAELSARINTGQGLLAKISGFAERASAQANLNDDVAEYQAVVSGFTPLLARALGHTGVLTEPDVQSVKNMLPQPTDSKSLRDRKVTRIETIMAAMPGAAGASPSPDPAPADPAGITDPLPPVEQRVPGQTKRRVNGVWTTWNGTFWGKS